MARRYLAQALLARGDRSGAKQIYSELVGRELMGRSAVRAQSWAHLELGVMAAQEGDLKVGAGGLEGGLLAEASSCLDTQEPHRPESLPQLCRPVGGRASVAVAGTVGLGIVLT